MKKLLQKCAFVFGGIRNKVNMGGIEHMAPFDNSKIHDIRRSKIVTVPIEMRNLQNYKLLNLYRKMLVIIQLWILHFVKLNTKAHSRSPLHSLCLRIHCSGLHVLQKLRLLFCSDVFLSKCTPPRTTQEFGNCWKAVIQEIIQICLTQLFESV